MIEIRGSGNGPESTHLVRVAPTPIAEPRFPVLRATLWWVLPGTAMLVGAWAAVSVLVGAGGFGDLSTVIACGGAAAVALFGGMSLFERLIGAPGAAVGAGVTVELIHMPFVEYDLLPGWSAMVGWLLTAVVTAGLIWRINTRRPPLLHHAEQLVTTRPELARLAGSSSAVRDPSPVTVSGRFQLSGWPRTALLAVELPGNPPAEIDAVGCLETPSSQGTAFVICNDGSHADLVTNQHLFSHDYTAWVSIAGTRRRAVLLPRPDQDRFAQELAGLDAGADRAQLRRLAEGTDLRLVRIDSTGLALIPLEISTSDELDEIALSVSYPRGGLPRFVWPAGPMPLPVVGIGRLAVRGTAARLWTPWRIQGGSSGGPVLVREDGRLRVAAVTFLQHQGGGSRGDAPHIPARVLQAYVAAVAGDAVDAAGARGVQA